MESNTANPGARRVRRSKDDIVDAALGILDEQGLPSLSMRRIGDVLGVQPSALYWHFPDKQTLLAAVSGRILEPMASAAAQARAQTPGAQTPGAQTAADLPAAVASLGARLRDCLLTYRDGAEVVSSSLALGLVESPLSGALAAVAEASGAPSSLARTADAAVTHFVVGYVFHEQQRLQADALNLVAARDALSPAAANGEPDDEFAAALALVVAGVRAAAARNVPDQVSK